MPRAQKPCVDCGKRVTPNFADSIPRCKPCTTKFQKARAAANAAASPAQPTRADERAAMLLAEQEEQVVYRTKRTLKPSAGGSRILMIPDLQIGPGTPTDHLDWIGKYIVDKRPDFIVQIGD
ncbi:MAG: hypothetical protein L0170_07290, partial [Acidobacteria bacterium]|nr:hypothetical protein [Acidobacteriota bacterium]